MWKPRIRGEFVWNNSSPFGGSPRGNLWELKCWQPWSFPWSGMSFSNGKPLAMPNQLVKSTGASSTRAETRIELAVTSKSCNPLLFQTKTQIPACPWTPLLWGQDAMLRSHRGRVRKAAIGSAMSPWPQPYWSSLHCTAAKAVSFFKCHASPRHQKIS